MAGMGCCVCCEQARVKAAIAAGRWAFRGFVFCPTCGNKRCPKATHHDNVCTGSNEPGQEGSVYR